MVKGDIIDNSKYGDKYGSDDDDVDDLYIIGAVCVSVSKSHYLLGKLFWQVNFFS